MGREGRERVGGIGGKGCGGGACRGFQGAHGRCKNSFHIRMIICEVNFRKVIGSSKRLFVSPT